MKRNEVIQIRVSADEKAAIERAAADAGKTKSDYLRELALSRHQAAS